jgi:regulator of replication initiation timing
MIGVDKLKQFVSSASSAISSLKRGVASLCEGLDELALEESALFTQLAPRDAVEENLAAQVAALGRRWTQDHGMELIREGSGRIERNHGHARSGDYIVPPRPLDEILGGAVSLDMLAALCPTVLLEGLRRVVQQTAYEPGPAMAPRLARLAAIEADRETLQRRHAALVDEAKTAGVTLEHLPEERVARFQKVQRREAWERDGRANETYYKHNPGTRPPEPA